MSMVAPVSSPGGSAAGVLAARTRRWGLLACGWANVGLAAIGVVVPGMPTTVFLIVAAWAFSRSCPRLRDRLHAHPRFGRPLREWDAHGVIPLRAKALALGMMAASLVLLAAMADGVLLPAAAGLAMAAAALYILTRLSVASVACEDRIQAG